MNTAVYYLLECDTKQCDRQLAYVLWKYAATFSYSKAGGSTFLQHIGKLLQDYLTLQKIQRHNRQVSNSHGRDLNLTHPQYEHGVTPSGFVLNLNILQHSCRPQNIGHCWFILSVCF